jgi:hypothetical protein
MAARRRGLALLALLAVACEGQAARVDAEASPRVPAPLDPEPDACARCHAEIVAEWRGSMHAQAWDDPIFRAEYDSAPAQSCVDCHNPPTRAAGSDGIDCATCHVREGLIVATRVSAAGQAEHAMVVDPRLGEVEHCGDCHQFRFTDDGIHDSTEALQNTVEEWRVSEAARRGQGCVACHMRRTPAGHRTHGFPGMADAQLLASALAVSVEARRSGDHVDVEVRLRGKHIGHAFPTGDVFRRAVLTLRSSGGASERIVLQRWLARTADGDGEDSHVRTVDDTRVPAPGQGEWVSTSRLSDPDARAIEWRLELQRLPPARARARGLAREDVVVLVREGAVAL